MWVALFVRIFSISVCSNSTSPSGYIRLTTSILSGISLRWCPRLNGVFILLSKEAYTNLCSESLYVRNFCRYCAYSSELISLTSG